MPNGTTSIRVDVKDNGISTNALDFIRLENWRVG